MHLDGSTWSAYLANTLAPAERAAVKQHLLEPCEACEIALSTLADVDRLDGWADDALLEVAALAPVSDDLGFARVRAQLQRSPQRSRAWASLALAVALVIGFFSWPRDEDSFRLKGEGGATLTVLRVGADGSPILAGPTIQVGSTLVFRVELETPTCLMLFGEEANNVREPLLEKPLCLSAGRHAIASEEVVLGLPVTRPGTMVVTLENDRGEPLDRRQFNAVLAP